MNCFKYIAIALLTISCGQVEHQTQNSEISNNSSELVIGWNDFKTVKPNKSNIPEKYRDMVDAIGLMLRLRSKCTVTYIGNNLAVTAGHCVNATEKEMRDKSCGYTDIKFGYIKGSKKTFTTKCERVISAVYSDEMDYAVIRVKDAPDVKVAIREDGHADLNTPITIFSHPMGRHLQWSKECSLLSADGFEDIPADLRFSYKCDTEPGSSGAAIIDSETLEIVGIHNGGDKNRNFATHISDTPVLKRLNKKPFWKIF